MGSFLVVLMLLIFSNGCLSKGSIQKISGRPNVVNIGSILSLKYSLVGKVAQIAIKAAVEDINSNPAVLKGTKINVTTLDSNSSGHLGIMEAIRFMETETVAIIGPQSSVLAHVISHIANELHVPLLSFAATDPTLSSLQYPYFVRTSPNDLFQMTAVAEIIDFYEWRAVIAVYIDDDFGRNGITALSDQLAARRCSISFKAPLRSDASRIDIQNVLVEAALTESRIVVVHTYPGKGVDVLAVAQYLGMLDNGFVWIATNWLSTVLDYQGPFSSDTYDNAQGVITLRIYTPDSQLKRNFISRWDNLTKNEDGRIGLNTYALYAYDTVWLLARAIDAFFTRNGNVSFSRYSNLSKVGGGSLHLDAMNIFNEGKLLLDSILNVNMTGVTGSYSFTSDRNLICPAFEVINVIGTGTRRIGYWSNYSGLSTHPPDSSCNRQANHSSSSQELFPVIWPGQTTHKPRGWVFPNNGRQLMIGVPNHASFREFVAQVPGTDMFRGYCIDVFYAAINLLAYGVPYKLIPYGDGKNNPSCTELVRLITTGVFDAAIGDIAITTSRTRMADFTQPYIESGLVVVAPVRKANNNFWAFSRPFTPRMWAVVGLFFLVVGILFWILEHRKNDDFRGPPNRQLVTILWFSLSTLFFAHKENIVSTIGRVVLVIWLFVVLIVKSSYTASLTSILTVQQLSSPIKGIETLLKSNDPIGYSQASFVRDYLIEELGIHESRLIPLNLPEDYVKALNDGPEKGGVAAIVDERAYIELFLSTQCEFSIIGQEFTRNGWGFAFPKDSPLAVDMSTAILKLSDNGELQRIHDKWLLRNACSSQNTKLEVDRLELASFSGLFYICGSVCIIALVIYFIILICQFHKHHFDSGPELSSDNSSRSSRIQTFLSFVDELEESLKARSVRKQPEGGLSNRSGDGNASMGNNSNGYCYDRPRDKHRCNKKQSNQTMKQIKGEIAETRKNTDLTWKTPLQKERDKKPRAGKRSFIMH